GGVGAPLGVKVSRGGRDPRHEHRRDGDLHGEGSLDPPHGYAAEGPLGGRPYRGRGESPRSSPVSGELGSSGPRGGGSRAKGGCWGCGRRGGRWGRRGGRRSPSFPAQSCS